MEDQNDVLKKCNVAISQILRFLPGNELRVVFPNDIAELIEEAAALLKETKKCQFCGDNGAERRRQNTTYENDELNWMVLCNRCQKEEDEYWRERWDDYYKNCM